MVGNEEASGNKIPILRFGLLIEKEVVNNQEQIRLTSNNQGIPPAEVILIVEAWLDKLKESIQKPIKDNFNFFDPNKDKDDR